MITELTIFLESMSEEIGKLTGREKYFNEKFGIYYDNAGSIFYNFNTKDEKEINVSGMKKEDIMTIVLKHNELLEEYKELYYIDLSRDEDMVGQGDI